MDTTRGPGTLGLLRRILAALLLPAAIAGCGGASAVSSHTAASTPTTAPAQFTTHHKRVRQRVVAALVPPVNAPARSVQVPVLTFHRLHSLPAVGILDLIVAPATFDAELTALQQHGYDTVSQARLFDALFRGRSLPPDR